MNFNTLAQAVTGRYAKWGLVPPLFTMMSLLTLSATIAGGVVAWGALSGYMSTFLPLWAVATAGVAGFALLNFWFQRELYKVDLSAAQVHRNEYYKGHNFNRMERHLRKELDAFYAFEFGINEKQPKVSLGAVGHGPAVLGVPGRNPSKAILIFGLETIKHTKLSSNELAALMLVELVKIRNRRGVSRLFASIGSDLLRLIEGLRSADNIGLQLLGFLSRPFDIALLPLKSLERSWQYEAIEVVAKLGRGQDLISAIDKMNTEDMVFRNTPEELNQIKAKKLAKVAPYDGYLAFLIKPWADWVDNNQWLNEDRSGYRVFTFLDIMVYGFGQFLKETFSFKPRTANQKKYARDVMATLSGEDDGAVYQKMPDGIYVPNRFIGVANGKKDPKLNYGERDILAELKSRLDARASEVNRGAKPIWSDGDKAGITAAYEQRSEHHVDVVRPFEAKDFRPRPRS